MTMLTLRPSIAAALLALGALGVAATQADLLSGDSASRDTAHDQQIKQHAERQIADGRSIFRFDTFGDEAFWGDALKLHQAIQGARFGGVGPGVSPRTALAVGLKVDVDALPDSVIAALKRGKVDLDDPATTLLLLRLDAVIGVKGF